jgi:DNA repair protein RecN (Recombination protein N)
LLSYLHVKNFAIIDELEVSFGEGLNILTGETGAGKSVILGSINLALGAKASGALIRTGAQMAFVELVFDVDAEKAEKLAALDVFPEDGQVVITRRIQENKSTSKINGETVTLSQIKAVASLLLDIHGQHEHQSLLSNKNHLAILDKYCGKEAEDLLLQVKEKLKEYKELKAEKQDLLAKQDARELDFLEYEINEIEELDIKEGEEEELAASLRKMTSGRKIYDALENAKLHTGSDEGAGDALGRAVRELSSVSSIDKDLEDFYSKALEIEELLRDLNYGIADYAESCIYDEEEMAETENRLDAIRNVFNKHGGSYESAMKFFEEASEKVGKLRDLDNYLLSLDKKIDKADNELKDICGRLSKVRKENAKVLEKEITQALIDLNFLDVKFSIGFTETEGFTGSGSDTVTFLISTNPGEPLRPLSEIASGGELSRVMLAIKSVMAEADEIPTLIFDEIDTGISGRTAQKVAEKMAKIAVTHQVFAITHLAQIAAMADVHFLIEKGVSEDRTATSIRKLEKSEQTGELARIIGGARITDSVLESAAEMKKLADEHKNTIKSH